MLLWYKLKVHAEVEMHNKYIPVFLTVADCRSFNKASENSIFSRMRSWNKSTSSKIIWTWNCLWEQITVWNWLRKGRCCIRKHSISWLTAKHPYRQRNSSEKYPVFSDCDDKIRCVQISCMSLFFGSSSAVLSVLLNMMSSVLISSILFFIFRLLSILLKHVRLSKSHPC